MPISLDITTENVGVGSLDWLASRKGFDTCRSVTLDLSLFSAAHYANGYIPSGTVLSKITATGLYGPYAGKADEVQVLTFGGSGLTSFTITYSGQTTTSIAAAADAATIQAALEALSNIAPGDVSVSGNVSGPFTIRFIGTLKNTDVAQVTTTPTGGTGTVTPSTTTVGGADPSNGSQTATGHLLHDARVADSNGNAFTKAGAAMLWEGIVLRSKLPAFGVSVLGAGELDSDAEVDLGSFIRYE